jgi:hypothetical protein
MPQNEAQTKAYPQAVDNSLSKEQPVDNMRTMDAAGIVGEDGRQAQGAETADHVQVD